VSEFDWVQHRIIVAEEPFFDCGAFSLRGAAWHPGTPFRSSVRDVYLILCLTMGLESTN
jgi:hypothetical protein